MIGKTVSHYRIVEKLGGGGMGVVYKAEDTRLHRDVALKFLPETHFEDPAARERFEREAQAASALNHPHICTVHDIGEHEGRPFIVMECLQGQTLKHRIAVRAVHHRGGPGPGPAGRRRPRCRARQGNRAPRREARQHLRHRAWAGQGAGLRPGHAEREGRLGPGRRRRRRREKHLTSPGTALGTVAYMSPEQALGKTLDLRTDLFSLGVVLYEMATGVLPFGGDTSAAIFDAILHKAPTSPLRLNPELPNELERIIRKCLEKDEDLRYQSARELMADLKRLRRDTTSGQSAAHPRQRARERRVDGAVSSRSGRASWCWPRLLAGGAQGPDSADPGRADHDHALHGRRRWEVVPSSVPRRREGRLRVGGARRRQLGRLRQGGRARDEAASHHGGSRHRLEPHLVARRPADRVRARVRGRMPRSIPIPSLGGQERKLVDIGGPATASGSYPSSMLSWAPDGEWLAFAEKASADAPARIFRLSLATLEKRPLTSPPPESLGDLEPQISPDGRLLAFVRSGSPSYGNQDVWVQPVSGGEARRLTSGQYGYAAALSWTPDGAEIVFSNGRPDFGGGRMARVPLTGGAPQPVVGVGENAVHASVRGKLHGIHPERDGAHGHLEAPAPRGVAVFRDAGEASRLRRQRCVLSRRPEGRLRVGTGRR